MASDADAFLRAIADSPDDDAPRLVFADWLDEHGEADRAEFIRAQCRSATLPEWDPERRALEWRAGRLLAARGMAWGASLPQLEGIRFGRFERGFPAEVVADGHELLGRHAAALEAVGTLSHVHLLMDRGNFRGVDDLPGFRWLRSLTLGPQRRGFSDDEARALGNSSLLATLDEFRCQSVYLSGPRLPALLGSRYLARIRRLAVNDSHLSERELPGLAGMAALDCLERLEFRGHPHGVTCSPAFTEPVARVVADVANLSSLRTLDVCKNSSDAGTWQAVFHSPHLAGLRCLIARNGLTMDPAECRAFANRKALPRLAAVDLTRRQVGRDGLAQLLPAPCLEKVEALGLSGCNLKGPDCDTLVASPWRRTLRSLDLSHNRIQAAGLRRLLAADWPQLRLLDVSYCALKSAGAKALAAWSGLRGLDMLLADGNEFTDDDIAALRAAGLPPACDLATPL